MKIATFNVNGINGRLPVLLRWLAETKPDVACLQELKAPQEKFPKAAIRLYAVNPDGTMKWKSTTGVIQAINSSPAIGTDGTVYFGSDDGNLYAVGAAIGSRPPH